MVYTPYDWNQAVSQRTEYIEERLRDGSPVVGLSLTAGVLLVTVHETQRKIYEIYDRVMFGGIGHQSDLELLRNAAIDFAHREGFQRSPDDVTLQRMVGAALSPAIKRAFGDAFAAPFIARSLFAELADSPESDSFYTLNYDGEYSNSQQFAVVAGSAPAENAMTRQIHDALPDIANVEAGLGLALEAWAAGKASARRAEAEEDGEQEAADDLPALLRDTLTAATVEAALLERNTNRESKFRLLRRAEVERMVEKYR
jgi:proteasome alpha subunit